MGKALHHKLIVRLVALTAVTFSLILVLRQDDQVGLGMAQSTQGYPSQAPIVVAHNEPGSPLAISAERQLAKTEQAPEVAFEVTNVTNKTIIAFAIRIDVIADSKVASSVSLHSLMLSAIDLPANRSLTEYDTYENLSTAKHRVTLSVDYVEFSDGKKWGPNSTKSAEHVAGQRAAIEALTTRVAGIVRAANANELGSVLESIATLEPPPQHSEEWNYGFRAAARSLANRLKRANQAGGQGQVNAELSKFPTRRAGDH